MDYREIALSEIDEDPDNLRPVTDLDELQDSIAKHGLLQNLVVMLLPTGRYRVAAGNRRLKALKALALEGRWDHPALCLVVDENPWTQLVENVCRQQVPIWRLGARYAELADAGHTTANIASRLGRPSGTISLYINIARGLHPDIIAQLEKMPPETFSRHQLARVARIINAVSFKPDFEAQKRELARILETRPRGGLRTSPTTERSTVWTRYQKLRDESVRYPPDAALYVEAIVDYLRGATDRLSFRGRKRATS